MALLVKVFEQLGKLIEQLNQLSPSTGALVIALIFGVLTGLALVLGILVISKS